eukprot:4157312-Amphidinium_carterae.1
MNDLLDGDGLGILKWRSSDTLVEVLYPSTVRLKIQDIELVKRQPPPRERILEVQLRVNESGVVACLLD